jgi:hypothetical protein
MDGKRYAFEIDKAIKFDNLESLQSLNFQQVSSADVGFQIMSKNAINIARFIFKESKNDNDNRLLEIKSKLCESIIANLERTSIQMFDLLVSYSFDEKQFIEIVQHYFERGQYFRENLDYKIIKHLLTNKCDEIAKMDTVDTVKKDYKDK